MADLLRGRYEILASLGRDGPTEVLRAIDRQHGQTVVLRVRRLSPGDDRAALLEDARTLLALRPHPAIPTTRDDFFLDDRYVLVIDWIDGATLDAVLADHGDPGLPVATVLGWLQTIASAVDHLHAQQPPVVHGDIRPQTLVVAPDGSIAVVFGTASLGGAGPGARGPYGAPELSAGARPGPAADVFAVAATAVSMLTGQPPVSGVPTTWDGVAPELAKRLDRVLRRALDQVPARRPATVGELVDRLNTARESALPTGVVTFVLTDIEGSTELWEAHPDAMVSVIAQHHELAGQIAEAHGGRMPRSQGEGDSTLSAFGRATDAVAAALAFQRALHGETWPDGIQLRVRAGLHTGEAQVEQGDYFGATVSRTARLRGLAKGGQVLMSRTTAELVTDTLPPDVALRDLGRFELKGLSRAEQVYELRAPDLPETSVTPGDAEVHPVARSAVPLPTVLDAGADAFVVREDALGTLRGFWQETIKSNRCRVVVLGGEPGIGKSWLVAAFARETNRGGATVLYGRSYEENLVPYQPFVEAVRHYMRTISEAEVRADLAGTGASLMRLTPDVAVRFPGIPAPVRAEPDTERYLMFEAVKDLLLGRRCCSSSTISTGPTARRSPCSSIWPAPPKRCRS